MTFPFKASKFGNKFETVNGITFRSKSEAERYRELKLLERAGTIRGLSLQVRYPLIVNSLKVSVYVADFVYTEFYCNGLERLVVEDRKGFRTREYVIKAKLLKAIYGIDILETGASKRKPARKAA